MKVTGNLYCAGHRQNKRTNTHWIFGVHCDWSRLSALLAGSSLVFAPLMAAHADGPAETSTLPPQTSESESLQEIIITARRKSEVLQDVPMTVTAVTPTEIQELNLQNLKDLAAVVPGLQIVGTGNRALDSNTFRGVSFQPATGTQNTLGFYINDTFVTNNFVTTSNFDVGQIELLSGPQGTLRGEPAPSGSLTITTHRPDLEQFGGYVNVTGTQYDNTNENGAVNLPIIKDKLAVRLAGIAEDNDLDGVRSVNSSQSPYYHEYAGRASVRFQPIDAIEANVMYQHLMFHQAQYPQVEGPGAPGGTFTPSSSSGYKVPAVIAPNYNGPPISATQLLGVQTFPSTTYSFEDLVTGQLDWHVLGQLVSYDGSYWKYTLNNGDGASGAFNQVPGITVGNGIPRQPLQFILPSTTQRVQTDELRIASETPIFGFLDYTAGAFYKHTKNQVDVFQTANFFGGSYGSPLAAANPFIYNPKYTLQLQIHSPAEEKETSEFAHLTFHLPYDTELTAGARHIDYKKDGFLTATLLTQGAFDAVAIPGVNCAAIGFTSTYPGTCDIPGNLLIKNTAALPFTPQNLTDHTWIYNASLSHKLNQDLLTYVNVGTSWRPPGIAVGISNAANDPVLNQLLHLKSEKSTDFEGGVKWTFLDNRGLLNVAYFHQTFRGLIYNGLPTLYLSDNGSGNPSVTGFAFTSNPDAVVNGVQLDTGFRFTHQWSANLTTTYSNGHLTGSEIPCNPPSGGTTPAAFPPGTHIFLCPSDASTTVTPNFNFSARTEYDMPIPIASGVDGFIRGLYSFSGRNPHASTFYVTPSYGILDLYTGLRSADGAWEGSFFAKNFLNTKVIISSGIGNPQTSTSTLSSLFGQAGYFNASVTPRQEFGITVTYRVGSR